MAHPGGRPTEYSQDILDKARAYRDEPLPEDEVVHSVEGLALSIGIARSTIYEWIGQEGKKEFSDIVSDILSRQGKTLINRGLDGKFNSSISKVMLSKHGYKEAIDTDHTTKGDKLESSAEIVKLAEQLNELKKNGN